MDPLLDPHRRPGWPHDHGQAGDCSGVRTHLPRTARKDFSSLARLRKALPKDFDVNAVFQAEARPYECRPKYVVSSTRKDFPWTNSHHIAGDLRTGVQKLKDATSAGVLLGSGTLATELDRLDLIDEYKFLVHPRIAGHGPTLYQSGLPSTRRLERVSAKPLLSGPVAMHYRPAR